MSGLRAGEVVLARLIISRITSTGQAVVKVDNYSEFVLPPGTVERIVRPRLQKGDRVTWRDSESHTGEVLSVDEDEFGHTYVWIREEGKWPRLTLESKELTRL